MCYDEGEFDGNGVKAVEWKKMKSLFTYSLPCMAEQLLWVMVTTISFVFAGRISKEAMTVVSMSNTLATWMQCTFVGFTTAGTVVVGRMWGSRHYKAIPWAFLQVQNTAFLISVVICVCGILWREQIVGFVFGAQPREMLSEAAAYLVTVLLGIPLAALINAVSGCSRGVGDNKTPLYTSLIYIIVHLVLCFFLTKPFGTAGIGIAMLCSRLISAVFGYIRLWLIKSPIRPLHFTLRFDKIILKRVLSLGSVSALEQLVFQGGFVVLQSLLLGFGTVFQGGYQIGANLNGIVNAPATAMGVAVTALISQALGRGDKEEAKSVVKATRGLVFTFFLLLGATQFFFAPLLSRIYTTDPEVFKCGIYFTRMFGIMVIPLAYFQSMCGVLRGAGDVRYVAAVSVIGLWAARIMSVMVLARLTNNGYLAVTVGISADFMLRAVAYHIRVQKGKWLNIRI